MPDRTAGLSEAGIEAAAKAMLRVRFPNARWESLPRKRRDKMVREAEALATAYLAAVSPVSVEREDERRKIIENELIEGMRERAEANQRPGLDGPTLGDIAVRIATALAASQPVSGPTDGEIARASRAMGDHPYESAAERWNRARAALTAAYGSESSDE